MGFNTLLKLHEIKKFCSLQYSSFRKTPPILIAGGGIGGLAAAIALARKGWPVTLLEKHKKAPEEGAGIQLGPNGTRILHELGIATHLKHLIAEPRGIRVMDGVSGSLLTHLPLGQSIAEKYGSPYWVLHRADLHAAMTAVILEMQSINFQTDSEVVNAISDSDGVGVYLKDGRHLSGCALIAADGIWSNVRTQILKRSPLLFSGKCALRAVIPSNDLPDELFRTDTTLWLRPSSHIVHYPVRGGREIAITAIFDDDMQSQNWSEPVDLTSLSSRTALFPSKLKALLAKPYLWRKWSLYTHNETNPLVSQRISLLGDAGHPILPFLAQGAVMALEDAAVLATVLDKTSNRDIPQSLALYATLRYKRVQSIQKASAQNGRIYHYAGMYRIFRNLALKILPPSFILSRYNWIYKWTINEV